MDDFVSTLKKIIVYLCVIIPTIICGYDCYKSFYVISDDYALPIYSVMVFVMVIYSILTLIIGIVLNRKRTLIKRHNVATMMCMIVAMGSLLTILFGSSKFNFNTYNVWAMIQCITSFVLTFFVSTLKKVEQEEIVVKKEEKLNDKQ